jgi:hypothetical protein
MQLYTINCKGYGSDNKGGKRGSLLMYSGWKFIGGQLSVDDNNRKSVFVCKGLQHCRSGYFIVRDPKIDCGLYDPNKRLLVDDPHPDKNKATIALFVDGGTVTVQGPSGTVLRHDIIDQKNFFVLTLSPKSNSVILGIKNPTTGFLREFKIKLLPDGEIKISKVHKLWTRIRVLTSNICSLCGFI